MWDAKLRLFLIIGNIREIPLFIYICTMKVKLTKISKVILVLCVLLLIVGVLSMIFVIDDEAARSRIVFSMFETLVMIVLILLPILLNRMIHVRIPSSMEIIFVVFCFGSLMLGDVADFYGRFPWWDDLQHGISGILLGILGYIIINTFNAPEQSGRLRFSPVFVSIWVLCFALSCGALWEIAEYCVDGWFGLNSQQFLESSGTFDASTPLVGHEALKDTMYDLMLDLAGGAIISIAGYFDMRHIRQRFTGLSLEFDKN